MGKHWTREELQLLKKHYQSYSKDKLLSLFPERDYDQILKKANKEGLTKRGRWSDLEIQILKRMYPYSHIETLKKEIPEKSEKAIIAKAKTLKLKKEKGYVQTKRIKRVNSWSNYEDAILKTYFPLGGTPKVQEHIPSRSRGSIQNRAIKLGVKYDPNAFDIWERHEVNIQDFGPNRQVKVTYTKR